MAGGSNGGQERPDGRHRWKPGVTSDQNPMSRPPTTNRASIDFVCEMMSWDCIDLGDPEAVMRRGEEYFALCAKYDSKPLISGLCASLGTNREEVMRWGKGSHTALNDKLTPASELALKSLLEKMEVFWEYAMANDGYRNPVSGIFLGKNNFGYKDQSETVVRHDGGSAGPTREQLAARYSAAIPEAIEAEDVRVDAPRPKRRKRLSGGSGKRHTV